MEIKIPLLPPDQDVETKSVMRQLAASHRYLALLNGKSATIPNENILINTLVLQEAKESSLPILYLSRYIIQFKSDYYNLLQHTRESNNWEEWLLFMLKGVEETAKQTLHLIDGIKQLMQEYKQIIRTNFPKIYSQDLLNNLFKHPYTKIDFLVSELNVDRRSTGWCHYPIEIYEGRIKSFFCKY